MIRERNLPHKSMFHVGRSGWLSLLTAVSITALGWRLTFVEGWGNPKRA